MEPEAVGQDIQVEGKEEQGRMGIRLGDFRATHEPLIHAGLGKEWAEAGVETAAKVADIVADNTAAIALNSPDVRPPHMIGAQSYAPWPQQRAQEVINSKKSETQMLAEKGHNFPQRKP
ncbi:hypothetical protein B0H13DRAFT_1870984 [Mycena leptocephala]|nr:hypothetical protein B0H13DRAFT_1870984 [Mycena leptocephala]